MPNLFTHCLPTIICVMLMSILLRFFYFCYMLHFFVTPFRIVCVHIFVLIGFCAYPLFSLCCFHSVVSVSLCWFLQFILICSLFVHCLYLHLPNPNLTVNLNLWCCYFSFMDYMRPFGHMMSENINSWMLLLLILIQTMRQMVKTSPKKK